MSLSRTSLFLLTFKVEKAGSSARTFVNSPIVTFGGLTALLKLLTTERASNSKVLYRLYSLLPTPLLAAIALPVSPQAATVNKLPPHMIGSKRQVSSLVVPLAKTNSATTTPCPCALVTSNPSLFSFVTKSLPSAATFAPVTQRLNKFQTKLRLCLATELAQLSTP